MDIIKINTLSQLEIYLKGKKFAVYGAGWGGWLFTEYFIKPKNLFPQFFIDRKFKNIEDNKKFFNILGVSIENLLNIDHSELYLVICIIQKEVINEIIKKLQKCNFKKVYVLSLQCFIELHKSFIKDFEIFLKRRKNYNYTNLKSKEYFKQSFNSSFCLIHIGWGKTGSTSIQFNLFYFNNFYKISSNFYYAKTEFLEHNDLIFLENKLKKWEWLPDYPKELIYKKRANILKNIIDSLKESILKNKNLIISAEHIPFLSYSNLVFLKTLITKFFPNVYIFGYIREPYSFVSSCFQEWLKNKFLDFTQLEKCYLGYKVHFEKIIKIFGKENTILKKFDPKRFPDGDVVKDFCQFWGISLSNKNPIKANISFPKEIVSIIYTLRKFLKTKEIYPIHIYFLAKLLKDRLPDYTFTPFKISKEVIKPIVEKNIEDIRWMEKVLGEPLIDEEALKEPEPPWVVKTEEDLLRVPDEVIEALRDYTGYKLSNTKPMPQQVAEMLYQILKENFPDI